MNNRKSIFFTSDWHLGHKNSIEFDQRPFVDLEHMHKVLINNYNSSVPQNGICFFLGDVGLTSSEKTKEIIKQLNGTKVLVLGNHDKGPNAMYDIGFDLVINSGSMYIGKQHLTFSHCPLKGIFREDISKMKGTQKGEHWHGESKNQAYSVEDHGQFHLSGHIHSPNGNKSIQKLGRQMDIGVPSNKYRPVSISQIESWIALTLPLINDWRNISGYEGYKVNYFGEIKSFRKYKNGTLLSPYMDKDGYLCISMFNGIKNKGEKIHRIVAKTFLDNPDNLPQVNHKNGHKLDTSVANLEWSSNTNNQIHAWKNGLKEKVLSVEDVKNIKKLIAEGKNNTEISVLFDVDPSTISNIKTGRTWKFI